MIWEQRKLSKRGALSEERLARLKSIGFVFDGWKAKEIRERAEEGKGKEEADDVDDEDEDADSMEEEEDAPSGGCTWEDNFKLLLAYKKRFTHVCPPSNCQMYGVNLGRWVSQQRHGATCSSVAQYLLQDVCINFVSEMLGIPKSTKIIKKHW